jgi:8-oxo-dGTP diphosphatase
MPTDAVGAPDTARIVQVVAAVIFRADGGFLLAQRPRGKVYEGYWEFPGGKIEPGESAPAALARELHEELGIEVERAYPWITRRYTYTHATVDLHFYRVVAFRGEPRSREGQAFAWQRVDAIDVQPVLPANGPIFAALGLPDIYAISNAEEMGVEPFLRSLEHRLASGLRLVQIREPALSGDDLERFACAVVMRAHRAGARVLINEDIALAERVRADGVHLKARQLRALEGRPDLPLIGASCHDEDELAIAARLGADFAVLGPVAPTPSHPGAPVLGWDRFAKLVRGRHFPIYALGGMRLMDRELAWMHGAHGIAMQRAAWARQE